ncbi:DUF262 domain-containing protein [Helicobacter pylori]|nr:DUF262 domain-containing protein [Helicobacter pylori]MDU9792052.1 DUF262 domain-containing protein [Helicobacter pylori]
MKVIQSIINDFFALTNTIFSVLQDIVSISQNKKTHFMGSITMLSIE